MNKFKSTLFLLNLDLFLLNTVDQLVSDTGILLGFTQSSTLIKKDLGAALMKDYPLKWTDNSLKNYIFSMEKIVGSALQISA